jgi:hypothetical protein
VTAATPQAQAPSAAKIHDTEWFAGMARMNSQLWLTERKVARFLAGTEPVDAHRVVAAIAQAVAPYGVDALTAVCFGAIRTGIDPDDAVALAAPPAQPEAP